MKFAIVTVMLAASFALPARAEHACAGDALKRAEALLKFHVQDSGAEAHRIEIAKDAKLLKPIRTPASKGKFDVLEVYGFIYKAEYRMHFIYAQIPVTCALMGQEIVEMSDPY
jgi:hypothetical protein